MVSVVRPGARRGLLSSAASMGLVCAGLASCGGSQGEPSELPTLTSATASASAPASPTRDETPTADGAAAQEQAVRKAAESYDALFGEFLAGTPFDLEQFQAVTADPLTTEQGKSLVVTQSQDYVVLGKPVSQVRKVTVSGAKAALLRCCDVSKQFVAKKGTTTKVPGAQVQDPGLESISLVRSSAGRWRVAGRATVKEC